MKYAPVLHWTMDAYEAWLERYSRQTALAAIGEEGQRRLAETSVVVVGAGGLGTNSADLLVRMGFGKVIVMDGDVIELSNLHRTRLYTEEDVGRPKVDVMMERLGHAIEGERLETLTTNLVPGNALDILRGADLVMDGVDNMETRYIINDACLELGIPWVYGGVVATGGLVAPIPAGGPCFRCLFPNPPQPGTLPTTTSHGIHPSLPSIVASIQVVLATRFVIEGIDRPELTAMDLWSDDWRVVSITRREDCPACVKGLREFLH